MFIATANLQDTIPGPLLEIIRLPGYTPMEKHQIAKRYLIPRQMQENGLKSNDIRFTRGAVDEIITYYTIEAGVRNLERTIGTICRKVARKIVENAVPADSGYLITVEEVQNLLGARKYLQDEAENVPQVGVATGMAWTSVGGSTLQVEATKMAGKGDLKLTGSLGDVMKESAMAAFSYVRSRSEQLGIPLEMFQQNDFHIHVPDGATPKDGPSAGVTLTTALVSLLTGKPVRPHLSMTGEITLRGKVTPVGGIKEKVIAALRYGIRHIIMPMENRKDLEDVPDEVKSQICFHFVSEIQEVLDFALSLDEPQMDAVPVKAAEDPNEIYTFVVPDEEEKTDTAEDQKKAGDAGELADGKNKTIPTNLVEKWDVDSLEELEKQFDPTDPELIREMLDVLQQHAEAKAGEAKAEEEKSDSVPVPEDQKNPEKTDAPALDEQKGAKKKQTRKKKTVDTDDSQYIKSVKSPTITITDKQNNTDDQKVISVQLEQKAAKTSSGSKKSKTVKADASSRSARPEKNAGAAESVKSSVTEKAKKSSKTKNTGAVAVSESGDVKQRKRTVKKKVAVEKKAEVSAAVQSKKVTRKKVDSVSSAKEKSVRKTTSKKKKEQES